MPAFAELPLEFNVAIFLFAAAVVAVTGVRIAAIAERLAQETGLGQAVTGAVLLGGATSLSGIAVSITAAANDQPSLAFANAAGGIAAQTTFLAIADMAYRKVNLEHDAASSANLSQAALLMVLLSIPLIAPLTLPFTLFGIHPASIVLFVGYAAGIRLVSRAHRLPMWQPVPSDSAQKEPRGPTFRSRGDLAAIWLRFMLAAAALSAAGFVIARSGAALAQTTGLSETLLGATFTAVSTSLPELVVAVAAVRRGALNLAVGNVLGGNAFDLLMVAAADLVYGQSIYHFVTAPDLLLLGAALTMTGILQLGMLRREKHGIANIGFESALVLVVYVGVMLIIVFGPDPAAKESGAAGSQIRGAAPVAEVAISRP